MNPSSLSPSREDLLAELKQVKMELRELYQTPHSQSNSGRMLGLRALERKQARLEARLEALEPLQK